MHDGRLAPSFLMVLGFNREATIGIGSSALLARSKRTVSRWGLGLVPALLGSAWSVPVLPLHARRPVLGQHQRAREATAIRSNCPHKRSLQESKLDQRLERSAPRPLPTCKTRLQANSAAAGLRHLSAPFNSHGASRRSVPPIGKAPH